MTVTMTLTIRQLERLLDWFDCHEEHGSLKDEDLKLYDKLDGYIDAFKKLSKMSDNSLGESNG